MLDLQKKVKPEMEKVIEHFRLELNSFNIGRANATPIENIQISAYGTMAPIKQLSSITISGANMVIVEPWDKTMLSDLVNIINKSDFGVSASTDGKVVRVVFPQLTTEKRDEIAKSVHMKAEEARVSIRSIRREAHDLITEQEKKGEITEDDQEHLKKELQKITEEFNVQIEKMAKAKEKEVKKI